MKRILMALIVVGMLLISFSPVLAHDNNNCNHTGNTNNDKSGNHYDEACTVNPEIVYVDRIVYVDKIVEKIVYVDKVVEKIVYVDKPTIEYRDKIVEKIVYVDKPVIEYRDKIVYKDKIVEVVKEVEVIVEEPQTNLIAIEKPACDICSILNNLQGYGIVIWSIFWLLVINTILHIINLFKRKNKKVAA